MWYINHNNFVYSLHRTVHPAYQICMCFTYRRRPRYLLCNNKEAKSWNHGAIRNTPVPRLRLSLPPPEAGEFSCNCNKLPPPHGHTQTMPSGCTLARAPPTPSSCRRQNLSPPLSQAALCRSRLTYSWARTILEAAAKSRLLPVSPSQVTGMIVMLQPSGSFCDSQCALWNLVFVPGDMIVLLGYLTMSFCLGE